ncbi:MAG: hypothetical protein GEV05_11395 [Betaproteobacteria bacterium]|nr:hypothetical protein [Betaproteobacteria bacterium]
MPATQLVYDPVAPCLTAPQSSRRSLDALAGKVIGFIDNSKPNFNLLVDELATLLPARYGVARVVHRRKRSASQAASETMLQELVEQCDAIITGSGD